jgi:hypothetical protein
VEWVEQAKKAGEDTPPVTWLIDGAGYGAAYRLVAYNVPDTTTTERELAAHTPVMTRSPSPERSSEQGTSGRTL